MSRSKLLAVIATCVVLVSTAPTFAVNEFAAKQKDNGTYTGVRGTQNIRTDPQTFSNESYVHFTQIYSPGYLDFLAVGTVNGMGTSDPQAAHNCSNGVNPLWSIYTDGSIGQVYFCYVEAHNVYDVGSQPYFKVERANCAEPPFTNIGWRITFGGAVRDCRDTAWTEADAVAVGLEHVGPNGVDRNIDVKMLDMEVKRPAVSLWEDWGNGQTNKDANYDVDYVNDNRFNTYLAPLD